MTGFLLGVATGAIATLTAAITFVICIEWFDRRHCRAAHRAPVTRTPVIQFVPRTNHRGVNE